MKMTSLKLGLIATLASLLTACGAGNQTEFSSTGTDLSSELQVKSEPTKEDLADDIGPTEEMKTPIKKDDNKISRSMINQITYVDRGPLKKGQQSIAIVEVKLNEFISKSAKGALSKKLDATARVVVPGCKAYGAEISVAKFNALRLALDSSKKSKAANVEGSGTYEHEYITDLTSKQDLEYTLSSDGSNSEMTLIKEASAIRNALDAIVAEVKAKKLCNLAVPKLPKKLPKKKK